MQSDERNEFKLIDGVPTMKSRADLTSTRPLMMMSSGEEIMMKSSHRYLLWWSPTQIIEMRFAPVVNPKTRRWKKCCICGEVKEKLEVALDSAKLSPSWRCGLHGITHDDRTIT